MKYSSKRIRELAKSSNIEMPGMIDFRNSFRYYQKARLYINTSKPDSDGLPNAYIQSWLSGTPVLSLHHDPNDWLQNEGIGYCAHGDFNKLKQKLQELLNDPSQIDYMGKRAQQFAENTFASEGTIQGYLELFREEE